MNDERQGYVRSRSLPGRMPRRVGEGGGKDEVSIAYVVIRASNGTSQGSGGGLAVEDKE